MKITIVLFDGVTTLDAVGGYEVLSRLPGVCVDFAARERGIVAADTRRLGLLAYRALDEVAATDVLYVPGGPGADVLETDEAFLATLRRLDATSTWTVGICNGVGLLAAAGMLAGRKATTNYFYRDRLAAYGVEVVRERYHRAGKYVTGAGVSASIDTALFLTQILAGDVAAKAIQLGIEYYAAPPFPERTPEEADPNVQAIVRRFEGLGREQLRRPAPWNEVRVGTGERERSEGTP